MVEDKDKHPRDDDRNDEIEQSPVPDPEAKDASAPGSSPGGGGSAAAASSTDDPEAD